jgi:hypothetical protein
MTTTDYAERGLVVGVEAEPRRDVVVSRVAVVAAAVRVHAGVGIEQEDVGRDRVVAVADRPVADSLA